MPNKYCLNQIYCEHGRCSQPILAPTQRVYIGHTDYMTCRADFVKYDFVKHDFSVYTGIINHV